MREIKFRAWDNYDGLMIYSNSGNDEYVWQLDIDSIVLLYHQQDEDLHFYPKVDNAIFMQFTGLKDRNGVDIYDGDILQLVDDAGNEIKVTCKYGIHSRVIKSGYEVEISGFAFISPTGLPTFPIKHNYVGKNDLDIMEIIGNIYENHELSKAGL